MKPTEPLNRSYKLTLNSSLAIIVKREIYIYGTMDSDYYNLWSIDCGNDSSCGLHC
nr:MAG TPA: hypothetical protein [Caudoviricetes sp.]